MLTKIFDYFRVKDWVYLLGIPTLGFVYNPNFNFLSVDFFSMLFLSSLGLAFAYSFDTHYSQFKSKSIILPSLIVEAFALAYASFLGFTVFLIALVSGLIIVLYTVSPFRLKGVPIAGTLLNAVGFPLMFLLGYSILSNPTLDVFLLVVFIALIFFPIQLIHEIAHYWQDKKEGLTTTPIRFGIRGTRSMIDALLVLLIFWSLFLYARTDLPIIFLISMIIFSFSFSFIMRVEKNAVRARMHIRYLGMVLGMMLLLVFRIS